MNTDDKLPSNYITAVQDGQVVIEHVESETVLKLIALGAQSEMRNNQLIWTLQVANDYQIGVLLSALRDLGILFVGGSSGWPPAEVFDELRSRGLIAGKFDELVWAGQGRWRVSKR
jgi:hypothetical protein